MDNLLLSLGRLAGIVGVLIAGFAGATRVTSGYTVGGFEAGTLLSVGIAAMVFACLCLLVVLTNRTPARR